MKMSAGAVRAPLIIPLRLPVVGVSKNIIDTKTYIDISSETPNTRIYFTIDGSKPDVKKCTSKRSQSGSTHLFVNTFCLPAGTRVVKAVAFLPTTHQESNVVTKTFDVKRCDLPNAGTDDSSEVRDDYGFLEEFSNRDSHRPKTAGGNSQKSGIKSSSNRSHPNLQSNIPAPIVGRSSTEDESFQSETNTKQVSSYPFSRIRQLEVTEVGEDCTRNNGKTNGHQKRQNYHCFADNFPPKCPTCLVTQKNERNPVACYVCGNALHQNTPASVDVRPRVARLNTCTSCGDTCLSNENLCSGCAAPADTTAYLGRKFNDLDRRLCPTCGSLNPVHIGSCLTCEAVLPQGVLSVVNISALLPRNSAQANGRKSAWDEVNAGRGEPSTSVSQCRLCKRLIGREAQFCDFCGAKSPHPSQLRPKSGAVPYFKDESLLSSSYHINADNDYRKFQFNSENIPDDIICAMCYAVNGSAARYCSKCGAELSPVAKNTYTFSQTINSSADEVKNSTRTICTQTVELFCPNEFNMKRAVSDRQLCKELESDIRSRAVLMTPISPGKGFWRMQLEHIIAHFKAYTRKNSKFRDLLGNPRLGKLFSAAVEENAGEFSVCLTFKNHNGTKITRDVCSAQNPTGPQPKSTPVRKLSASFKRQRNNSNKIYKCSVGNNGETNFDGYNTSNGDISQEEFVKNNGNQQKVQLHSGNQFLRDDRLSPAVHLLTSTTENCDSSKDIHNRIDRHSVDDTPEKRMAKLLEIDKSLINELRFGNNREDEKITRLLSNGANPNCITLSGDSALVLAVRNRHAKAVQLLALAGANLNVVDTRQGNTALHEAILLGSNAEEVIKVLLKLGADPNHKNAEGLSPYEIAVQSDLRSILKEFDSYQNQKLPRRY